MPGCVRRGPLLLDVLAASTDDSRPRHHAGHNLRPGTCGAPAAESTKNLTSQQLALEVTLGACHLLVPFAWGLSRESSKSGAAHAARYGRAARVAQHIQRTRTRIHRAPGAVSAALFNLPTPRSTPCSCEASPHLLFLYGLVTGLTSARPTCRFTHFVVRRGRTFLEQGIAKHQVASGIAKHQVASMDGTPLQRRTHSTDQRPVRTDAPVRGNWCGNDAHPPVWHTQ